MGYDVFGGIHGQADPLEALLGPATREPAAEAKKDNAEPSVFQAVEASSVGWVPHKTALAPPASSPNE
jgi:hypothetical protein